MKRSYIIVAGIVVLAVAGYLFFQHKAAVEHEQERSEALETQRDELWDRIGMLEKNVSDLEEELALHKEPAVPEEKLAQVFGEKATEQSPAPVGVIDCVALDGQARAVFSYLDTKEYVQEHALENGTFGLAQEVLRLLSHNPPAVAGEMKDMVSLTRNIAHFYRILGAKRLMILKEIMTEEADVMESFLATLFPWLSACPDCAPEGLTCPSLETLYQYAGFCLNTLAGKSYLSRRDSRLRVLVVYYSVLILHQANEQTLNRHGIDIRAFIESLSDEIRNHKGLVYKKQYMDRLKDLREKYQM